MSPANGQLWQSKPYHRNTFWWLWSGCSPLPIPNREVKPRIADDTALVCGKVGRRQSFLRGSLSGSSFFYAPWRNKTNLLSLIVENQLVK